MQNFADSLVAAIKAKNSVVCVGLDPQLGKLPKGIVEKAQAEHGNTLHAAAVAFFSFNKWIIDSVKDLVVAVKPQLAFYEELGHEGIWAFEETCKYAREAGLLVIADGKRNDIGSTAEAYARAFLGGVDLFGVKLTGVADALTVNAYLGLDGVKPFLGTCHEYSRGIFILVRTSNPSSGDLQARITADEGISVAELMGHFVESWGSDLIGESGYSSVGAVVGATYPEEAKKLRSVMPKSFFLLPGFGAQGGTAADVADAFNEDGLGALVVSARGIIFAEDPRAAALEMRDELNKVRG